MPVAWADALVTPIEHDVVLAIDVGDAKLSAGVMTTRGELLDRDSVDIDQTKNGEVLFAALSEIAEAQLERARAHHNGRPVAVGVGCIGPVQQDVETVSPAAVGAWRTFPLRSKLAAVTSLPVYGDVGARALTLAEGWLGAAQGRDSFATVVVSATVDGGIVLNGQLLDGASGHAGSIGHIVVEPNGRRCPCGSRGCLEAETSAAAIEGITGRSVSEPTYEIMQRTGRLVGRAVASVCNLLDIDFAVVGGPVALNFGATFFNSAQETLDEHARLSFSRGARIIPTRLGDRGPLIGAGAVGLRGLRRAARAA
jgi:glucokinase